MLKFTRIWCSEFWSGCLAEWLFIYLVYNLGWHPLAWNPSFWTILVSLSTCSLWELSDYGNEYRSVLSKNFNKRCSAKKRKRWNEARNISYYEKKILQHQQCSTDLLNVYSKSKVGGLASKSSEKKMPNFWKYVYGLEESYSEKIPKNAINFSWDVNIASLLHLKGKIIKL